MTVTRIRQIGIGIVAVCASAIVVTPFTEGALSVRIFACAVLAFPSGLAAVALHRAASPLKASIVLAGMLIAFESAGLYVAGFEGSQLTSLSLMASLALIPLLLLGSLYAWIASGTDTPP